MHKFAWAVILYIMVKIGVIDSGIGGLSIIKSLIDYGIYGEYYYVLDTKHCPYGSKTTEELNAITFLNIEKLIKYGVELIVLACNTVTAACYTAMKNIFSIPIIGTSPPIALASECCKSVLILATPYTVRSEKVASLISMYPDVDYYIPDCSVLAPTIEVAYADLVTLSQYVTGLVSNYRKCGGVVIGCTHYNYIVDLIKNALPDSVIFQSNLSVAKEVYALLKDKNINDKDALMINCIVTGSPMSDDKLTFLMQFVNLGLDKFVIV